MSNNVDPDETAHEPSHLDLRCLQKYIIMACGSERDNILCKNSNLIDNLFSNNQAKVLL